MTFGLTYWRTPAVKPSFPAKIMKATLAAEIRQHNAYRARLDKIHRDEREKKENPSLVEETLDLPPWIEVPLTPLVPSSPGSEMDLTDLLHTIGHDEQENPFLVEEAIHPAAMLPNPVSSPESPFSIMDYMDQLDTNSHHEEENRSLVAVPIPMPESPVSIVHDLQNMSSLHKMFATIPPATITKIVGHEFKPMDLATLNPRRCWDKFDGGCSLRDYPSLQSLLVPVCLYFSVLQAGVSAMSGDSEATRVVGESGLRYIAHLVELEELYQWPAVVQYHMQFHNKRRQDMVHDDYSHWAVGDRELINRLLVGRQRGRHGGKQLGVPSSSGSAKSCPKKP
ncbi:hypothetical protein B0H19DRAFT_699470 [Mycena capillaripes]|nr:hypothetical protein B0H19DRAFT_699470 [Mycena capillaripes]